LGIIDTLSAGFRTVSRRLWLVVVPVLLDLYLWLGPKLSIRPIIERLVTLFRTMMATASMPPANGSADAVAMAELMLHTFEETLGSINLFALLAWGRLGVPSVTGVAFIPENARWTIEISGYGQALVLQLLLLGAGLLIACVYLSMLADTLRINNEESFMARLRFLMRRVPTYWLHLAIIFVPLSMLFMFTLSVGMLLGPLSVFVAVGVLWAMLFLAFVPQAVTLAEHRPLMALWSSVAIVRINFWSTLGIVLLTNVIGAGLGLIWNQLLLGSTVGTLAAILANAYVGTGLTMALFIFYRDRIILLRQRLEEQRSI
jgi:hypothetical protein